MNRNLWRITKHKSGKIKHIAHYFVKICIRECFCCACTSARARSYKRVQVRVRVCALEACARACEGVCMQCEVCIVCCVGICDYVIVCMYDCVRLHLRHQEWFQWGPRRRWWPKCDKSANAIYCEKIQKKTISIEKKQKKRKHISQIVHCVSISER